MAESKPVTVKNLMLFDGHCIVFHVPSQLLYAIPRADYDSIIKGEKVGFLSDLPDKELVCYRLDRETESITSNSKKLIVEDLEGVGYGETRWGDGLRIYFFTDKRF